MKAKLFCTLLALTTAVLVNAPPAGAQVSDTDFLNQLRAEIQADRQAVVALNMGLSDAEGKAFWPVYREYRAEIAAVGDRLQELIQSYAEVWDSATDEQARSMVDELLAIQRDELEIKSSYVSRFREVLPEVKVARLVQIENRIDALLEVELVSGIPLIATSD